MKAFGHIVLLVIFTFSLSLPAQGLGIKNEGGENRYWVEAMAEVHERFSGEKGTFA